MLLEITRTRQEIPDLGGMDRKKQGKEGENFGQACGTPLALASKGGSIRPKIDFESPPGEALKKRGERSPAGTKVVQEG